MSPTFVMTKFFVLHGILFATHFLFGPNNWNKARNHLPCKLLWETFGRHRHGIDAVEILELRQQLRRRRFN